MRAREYKHLEAEKIYLLNQLEHISSDKVINRANFEIRLDEIQSELDSVKTSMREPAHAIITFRGKPVVGSFGILAGFGAKAVNKFADAVVSIASNLEGNTSGNRGVITNADNYQLIITGTALGSFGFELEENIDQTHVNLNENPSILEKAIEKAQKLLEASLGTDEELSDAMAEIDDRTVKQFHEFLHTLVENNAYCALEVDDKYFTFHDEEQVKRSAARINTDNITDTEITLAGQFIGVLPKSRTFEFVHSPTQEVIKGRVGSQIVDPMEINHYLEKELYIVVESKVVGEGKPRFTLKSFEKK